MNSRLHHQIIKTLTDQVEHMEKVNDYLEKLCRAKNEVIKVDSKVNIDSDGYIHYHTFITYN